MTGRSTSVPTSRKACVLSGEAASQRVKCPGTIIGHRLIATPQERQREQRNRGGATIVLVGVHPSLTQVPPRCSRSISATRRPASASRAPRNGPAWPAPMMIASNSYTPPPPLPRRADDVAGGCVVQDQPLKRADGRRPRRLLQDLGGVAIDGLPSVGAAARAEIAMSVRCDSPASAGASRRTCSSDLPRSRS